MSLKSSSSMSVSTAAPQPSSSSPLFSSDNSLAPQTPSHAHNGVCIDDGMERLGMASAAHASQADEPKRMALSELRSVQEGREGVLNGQLAAYREAMGTVVGELEQDIPLLTQRRMQLMQEIRAYRQALAYDEAVLERDSTHIDTLLKEKKKLNSTASNNTHAIPPRQRARPPFLHRLFGQSPPSQPPAAAAEQLAAHGDSINQHTKGSYGTHEGEDNGEFGVQREEEVAMCPHDERPARRIKTRSRSCPSSVRKRGRRRSSRHGQPQQFRNWLMQHTQELQRHYQEQQTAMWPAELRVAIPAVPSGPLGPPESPKKRSKGQSREDTTTFQPFVSIPVRVPANSSSCVPSSSGGAVVHLARPVMVYPSESAMEYRVPGKRGKRDAEDSLSPSLSDTSSSDELACPSFPLPLSVCLQQPADGPQPVSTQQPPSKEADKRHSTTGPTTAASHTRSPSLSVPLTPPIARHPLSPGIEPSRRSSVLAPAIREENGHQTEAEQPARRTRRRLGRRYYVWRLRGEGVRGYWDECVREWGFEY
ncbi:unnamed protein product [Vitrella brassicaformis CCMP3155]|uniref:Uncharacterized protein n=2 Tax=Vitrella brassicaformis TaxID=1169539 RepID=A0A0G4GMA0_VITBC|nr:unnamed protein product [Vitrella brassicaformis CCMP3155]|eukprot:CEM31332.1 unnamed protein product [Vitrella brassicaformis CCMP3155]